MRYAVVDATRWLGLSSELRQLKPRMRLHIVIRH